MNAEVKVELCKLDPAIELPAYAYPGDAGLDLRAAADITLAPFERSLIPTGFCMALPGGYAAFILPRSGMAFKHGLSLINTPGLIDSEYRGEIKVAAINLDATTPVEIKMGDRIAQMVIAPVPLVTLIESESLDETERGSGGFGSSGTN